MFWLPTLFALVALIYASVGFGGGSTYSALLALSDVDYRLIPVIALLCNIIVVTGGTIRFVRAGLIDWRAVLPLVAVSAPLAFIGGLVPLKQSVFYMLLGSGLLLSSLVLLVRVETFAAKRLPQPLLLCISGAVGLLAGLSGIGGGIFMSPVLHLIRWADAKRIAAVASLYILINSITGIAGQLVKAGPVSLMNPAAEYWPLMIGVLVGGQIGSYLGLRLLSAVWIRRLTAVLVGYVAIRLLWQGWNLL
ncbi:MAG: sulfite exporter TauE/SafE family protein [Sphingorhabdus sp.]